MLVTMPRASAARDFREALRSWNPWRALYDRVKVSHRPHFRPTRLPRGCLAAHALPEILTSSVFCSLPPPLRCAHAPPALPCCEDPASWRTFSLAIGLKSWWTSKAGCLRVAPWCLRAFLRVGRGSAQERSRTCRWWRYRVRYRVFLCVYLLHSMMYGTLVTTRTC